MTHEELRKQHFERLNSYRQSTEYALYAQAIGVEPPHGDLASLLGSKWQIDEAIYHEFLEMLPPLGWRGDTFYLSEFTFGDVTAKFSKEGDKYYCEFVRYPERSKPVVETPWGPAQTSKEIAPGIMFHSTASHGGFHLSPERIAEMPKPLREFTPFGGGQRGPGRWFEEDCDWSVVALAFPQFFPPDALSQAQATLASYKPELYKEVVAMRAEQSASDASPRIPTRYLSKWLDIGKKNPWIREAADPPFNTQSFHECKDDAELLAKFRHGNWSLGQAFHIGDLCFINQVDGGDEWLTIKKDVPFESISFGRILADGGEAAAQDTLQRIREATDERCRSLDY